MRVCRCLVVALAVALAWSAVHAQPCSNHIVPGYGPSPLVGIVSCGAVFDDLSGTGPALFIAGNNLRVDTQHTTSLAKLVNGRWVRNADIAGSVMCLAVLDDGSGPALYLGGNFTIAPSTESLNVAKWDGVTWTRLPRIGGVTSNGNVYSLALYDDGAGVSLYAGGWSTVPSPVAPILMKWGGQGWVPLSAGVSGGGGLVRTILSYDDGTGQKLYVGGNFTMAGSVTVTGLASWDGSNWAAVGPGFQSGTTGTDVHALAVYDDGTGPGLYAAGAINLPDRHYGNSPVAVWRNGAWTRVLGIGAGLTANAGASAIATFDDGTGPSLYAAVGDYAEGGNRVWRLHQGNWSTVGDAFSTTLPGFGATVNQFISLPTSAGERIVVLGNMTSYGAELTPPACRWNGSLWVPVESYALGLWSPATVLCDEEQIDPTVYALGMRLTSEGWSTDLGSDPYPSAGYVHMNYNGARVTFTGNSSGMWVKTAGTWQTFPSPGSGLFKLAIADDGSGDALYAIMNGSWPNGSGGTDVGARLERWSGSSWEFVGPVLVQSGAGAGQPGGINCLTFFDDGSGAALHVGGTLAAPGGSYLAKLVNGQWVATGGIAGPVNDMIVYDVGEGPELILAGSFGVYTPMHGVQRWNGSRIAAVGSGVGAAATGSILRIFDDGGGPRLWVATAPAGTGLTRWNGTDWEVPVPPPLSGFWVHSVTSVAAVNRSDGTRSLLLGGTFTSINGVPCSNIAELAVCPHTCTADFDGDGVPATDQDIEAFFACLAGSCCATCGSTDFNNDGDAATDADIESFFRVLAGGAC